MALFVSEEQIIQSGGNREHLVFAHLFSHPRATADILFLKHDRSIFRQPFDSNIYVFHGSAQKPVLLASQFRQMGFAGHLFVFIRQANGNGPTFSWPVPGRDITVVGPFPEGMSLQLAPSRKRRLEASLAGRNILAGTV